MKRLPSDHASPLTAQAVAELVFGLFVLAGVLGLPTAAASAALLKHAEPA